MSNRTAVKSAFEGLRPTILRQPTRSDVPPEAERALLATSREGKREAPTPVLVASAPVAEAAAEPSTALPSAPLLQKKKKEPLLLVSFRMPQSLKERLETAAKKHEINQTDLINEAIQLNLQRYL